MSVTGVPAGLVDAELPSDFDLVVAMYPALRRTDDGVAQARLLDVVAPGGHLVFVHHADVAPGHGWNPEDYVGPDAVLALALERGGWDVVTNERRPRNVSGGAGAHHRDDRIIHLRRA